MQGLNQLGKGPSRPRPHQRRRPNNNNRGRQEISLTDGIKADADYYKMVQEIEEQQQGQGWLFSRGAADKGDLLYLRDQEEKLRFVESERREKENELFTMQRKLLETRALGPASLLGKRQRAADDKQRSQQALQSLLTALKPDTECKAESRVTPATSATASPTVAPRTPGVGSSAAQTPSGSPAPPINTGNPPSASAAALDKHPHVHKAPQQDARAPSGQALPSSSAPRVAQSGQSSNASSTTRVGGSVVSPQVTVTGGGDDPGTAEALADAMERGNGVRQEDLSGAGGLLAGFAAYQSDSDSEEDE